MWPARSAHVSGWLSELLTLRASGLGLLIWVLSEVSAICGPYPGKPSQGSEVILRLEFHPLQKPEAEFLSLDSKGVLCTFVVSPTLLTVNRVTQQQLPPEELAAVTAAVKSPEFVEAFNGSELSPEPMQGDRFRLWVNVPPASGELRGILAVAPAVVQSTVQGLLAKSRAATDVPAADCYLRSERIGPERYETLRVAGRVRFHPITELEADVLPDVEKATVREGEFFAIAAEQKAALLPLCSYGREIFLTKGDTKAFQLVIFEKSNTR